MSTVSYILYFIFSSPEASVLSEIDSCINNLLDNREFHFATKANLESTLIPKNGNITCKSDTAFSSFCTFRTKPDLCPSDYICNPGSFINDKLTFSDPQLSCDNSSVESPNCSALKQQGFENVTVYRDTLRSHRNIAILTDRCRLLLREQQREFKQIRKILINTDSVQER